MLFGLSKPAGVDCARMQCLGEVDSPAIVRSFSADVSKQPEAARESLRNILSSPIKTPSRVFEKPILSRTISNSHLQPLVEHEASLA